MNEIEILEINLLTHSQMIFDKCIKSFQWKRDSLFNKYAGKNMQIGKDEPLCHMQNECNMNQRPKQKVKAIKQKKSQEKNLCDIGLDSNFLTMTLKEQAIKDKIDNLNCITHSISMCQRTHSTE